MESLTLTIHWHDELLPIYSVEFQPAKGAVLPRLATSGGDNNIRIWNLVPHFSSKDSAEVSNVKYLSTLRKHTQAVNSVRFDSTGTKLASAGDDGSLIIWIKADSVQREFGEDEDGDASELWIAKKILRSSASEIYDIAWSPDGNHIAVGSMDNSLRIYHLSSGKSSLLRDHLHYVQGVAWDPLGEFLVSQLADRSINVYKFETQDEKKSKDKGKNDQDEDPKLVYKNSKGVFENDRLRMLYHSETLQSFFRRLAFSPDGSLLMVPLGIYKSVEAKEEANESTKVSLLSQTNEGITSTDSNEDKTEKESYVEENAVYVYTRSNFKTPVCVIPGLSKPALVVSFSPIVYKSLKNSSKVFKLPYKMVFAIATQDLVLVYDTESLQPLGFTLNLHYLTITDLAWNTDGLSLVASSTDGFCSLVTFKAGLFGKPTDIKTETGLTDRETKSTNDPFDQTVTGENPEVASDKPLVEVAGDKPLVEVASDKPLDVSVKESDSNMEDAESAENGSIINMVSSKDKVETPKVSTNEQTDKPVLVEDKAKVTKPKKRVQPTLIGLTRGMN